MLAIDAFRRRYLDVRFRTRGSSRARIVEFPGRWMAQEEQDRLVEDIRTVVRTGVPAGSLDYGVLSDPERLKHAVLTIIYAEPDGRPVAFNALHVLPCDLRGREEDVVHLGLLMVDPEFRQHGLTGALYGITCFLLCMRRQMRPMWISNVTQVPLVFGIVGDFIEDVFPAAHPGSRSGRRCSSSRDAGTGGRASGEVSQRPVGPTRPSTVPDRACGRGPPRRSLARLATSSQRRHRYVSLYSLFMPVRMHHRCPPP